MGSVASRATAVSNADRGRAGLCCRSVRASQGDRLYTTPELEVLSQRCLLSRQHGWILHSRTTTELPKLARLYLAQCAASLASEHHLAIARLIEANNTGSAAALLRPLLEASATAYWLAYCAPPSKIKHLINPRKQPSRKDRLPLIGGLLEAIVEVFPEAKLLHDSFPGYLHAFTHGQMIQITRKGHYPPFSYKEKLVMLWLSDSIQTTAAAINVAIHDTPNLSEYIAAARQILMNEGKNLYNLKFPKESWEWKGLPDIKIVDQWDDGSWKDQFSRS